ncbi:hypothetical protein D4764_11G0003470 [Takifugu flavidus]|uniref:Reverse transcriptase zinc-binding domain-containing protein n=1 Tax=Takifugu flavidus TaxID=433684 RepID=A0A5C6PH26_9TELE|nr:hypothetical protein D4764_11G0003470 [Takifugu flavidus]
MREAGVITLGQLVNVCGPRLDNAAALTRQAGIRAVRILNQLLEGWRHQLAASELELISKFCKGRKPASHDDPFLDIRLTPVLGNVPKSQLLLKNVQPVDSSSSTGKLMYNTLVKILNQRSLAGRVDTTETQRAEWRSLYKPPLTRRGRDLQGRILHGAIAVNRYLSNINSNISAECPLCDHREMVFHCFSECGRLSVLFLLFSQMFSPAW